MDDYDPACPTEDENQFAELDLSQVPLPPPILGQGGAEPTRVTSLSPSPPVLVKEEEKKGKKKKKKKKRKHGGSRSQPDGEGEDEREDGDVEMQDSDQNGLNEVPILEPMADLEPEEESKTVPSKQGPPTLIPQPQLVSNTKGSSSPPPTTLTPKAAASSLASSGKSSGKLHFTLTSDPGSRKAKVSFQLKKNLRTAFQTTEEEEEEGEQAAVEEEDKELVEKTAAGEYIPTRFKVAKKHEMYRPSQDKPGITVVFNSAGIGSVAGAVVGAGTTKSNTSSLTAEPDEPPLSLLNVPEHPISSDAKLELGSEESVRVSKDERKESENNDHEKYKKDDAERMFKQSEEKKMERTSERRSGRRGTRENEKDKSSSTRSFMQNSRGERSDRERYEDKRRSYYSSRDRQKEDDRKKDMYDISLKNDESERVETRKKPLRHRRDEEESKKEDRKDSNKYDKKIDDGDRDNNGESKHTSSRSEPESTLKSRKQTSNRNRRNSNEKKEDEESLPVATTSSQSPDVAKSEVLDVPAAASQEIPDETTTLETPEEKTSHQVTSEAENVASSSSAVEERTSPNAESAVKEIPEKLSNPQKIVIRRAVDSNDFEVARNDLADDARSKGEDVKKHSKTSKKKGEGKEKKPASDSSSSSSASSSSSSESEDEKQKSRQLQKKMFREKKDKQRRRKGSSLSAEEEFRGRRRRQWASSSDDETKQKSPVHKELGAKREMVKVSSQTEQPTAPQEVFVDVSALPGKSKWEMDDEEEVEVAETTPRVSRWDTAKPEMPIFTVSDLARFSGRSQRDFMQRPSLSSQKPKGSSSNEDDLSNDLKKAKEKKKHKHKDKAEKKLKKKKKKKQEDSGGEEGTESQKKRKVSKSEDSGDAKEQITVPGKPVVVQEQGKPNTKTELDKEQLVSYLRDYSAKDELAWSKMEIDNVKLVSYLKEYSGKMASDSTLQIPGMVHVDDEVEEPLKPQKEPQDTCEQVGVKEEQMIDSGRPVESDAAADVQDDEGEVLEIAVADEVNKAKKPHDKTMETSGEALIEKLSQSQSFEDDRSQSKDRQSRSSSQEENVRDKSSERSMKSEKRSSITRDRRNHSPSLERSGSAASKSSQRSKDKWERSTSERNRKSFRNRSRSTERRNRSRSLERKNRSRSPEKARGSKWSRSPSPRRYKDRRNRSRSPDRRNHNRRGRSRSRSYERSHSYRRYRSPARDSFGRVRRDRDTRRRSRSDSGDKFSSRRKRGGSEDKESTQSSRDSKRGSSPHEKDTNSGGKRDKRKRSWSAEPDSKIEPETMVPLDISSIPIPDEIPLPGEKITVSKQDKSQPAEDKTREASSVDILKDEPMEISDEEKESDTDTNVIQIESHDVKDNISENEIQGTKVITEESSKVNVPSQPSKTGIAVNLATMASGKDRQIKFSIMGGSRKLKPARISGILGDDGEANGTDRLKPLKMMESDEDSGNVAGPHDHAQVSENVEEKEIPLQRKYGETDLTVLHKPSDADLDSPNRNAENDDSKETDDKNTKASEANSSSDKVSPSSTPPQRLKFKYIPLWEMEETEKKPHIEEPIKTEGLGLALDYGSGSSDYEEDESSPVKRKVTWSTEKSHQKEEVRQEPCNKDQTEGRSESSDERLKEETFDVAKEVKTDELLESGMKDEAQNGVKRNQDIKIDIRKEENAETEQQAMKGMEDDRSESGKGEEEKHYQEVRDEKNWQESTPNVEEVDKVQYTYIHKNDDLRENLTSEEQHLNLEKSAEVKGLPLGTEEKESSPCNERKSLTVPMVSTEEAYSPSHPSLEDLEDELTESEQPKTVQEKERIPESVTKAPSEKPPAPTTTSVGIVSITNSVAPSTGGSEVSASSGSQSIGIISSLTQINLASIPLPSMFQTNTAVPQMVKPPLLAPAPPTTSGATVLPGFPLTGSVAKSAPTIPSVPIPQPVPPLSSIPLPRMPPQPVPPPTQHVTASLPTAPQPVPPPLPTATAAPQSVLPPLPTAAGAPKPVPPPLPLASAAPQPVPPPLPTASGVASQTTLPPLPEVPLIVQSTSAAPQPVPPPLSTSTAAPQSVLLSQGTTLLPSAVLPAFGEPAVTIPSASAVTTSFSAQLSWGTPALSGQKHPVSTLSGGTTPGVDATAQILQIPGRVSGIPLPPTISVAPVPPPGVILPVQPVPPPSVTAPLSGLMQESVLAANLPIPVTIGSVVTSTSVKAPPVKFRISRFHQGPGASLPVPPPSVSIPVIEPPTVTIPSMLGAKATSSAGVVTLAPPTVVEPPKIVIPAQPSLTEDKVDGKSRADLPTTSAPSKRPRISSILSQPKIEDPALLQTLGVTDVKSKHVKAPVSSSEVTTSTESSVSSASSDKPTSGEILAPASLEDHKKPSKSEMNDVVSGSQTFPKEQEEIVSSESTDDLNSNAPEPSTIVVGLKTDVTSTSASPEPISTNQEVQTPQFAEAVIMDMGSIPLPGEIPPPVSKPAPPLPSVPVPEESAPPLPPSSPPSQQQPPLPVTTDSSAPSSPATPKGQTLGGLLAERKKRFSQSPLAIGMLPKVALTQSPLAIGPLPNLPPDSETGIPSPPMPTPKNISSSTVDGNTKPKFSMQLGTSSKQKKPQLQHSDDSKSSSKISIVLKSKPLMQRAVVPGFEDEGSEDDSGSDVAKEDFSDLDNSILSVFAEDKEETPPPPPPPPPAASLPPFPVRAKSAQAAAGSEELLPVSEAVSKEKDRSKEKEKLKDRSSVDIEAFPVQVITSSRKEEETPASSWPEFTVGKGDRREGKSEKDGKRFSDRDDRYRERKKDKRGSREKDNDREEGRRNRSRRDEEDEKKDSYKRRGEESRRKDDEYDDEVRRNVKKEKEDDYFDTKKGNKKEDRDDSRRRGRSDTEEDNRRRNRDDDVKYSRRRGRYDDDDYSRKKTREFVDDDDYYGRRRDDKDDDRKRHRYEAEGRGSRRSDRDRSQSRDRSWDRDRSREKESRDHSWERERGERERSRERNRGDKSSSRSNRSSGKRRSRSPARRRDRDRSRERYERNRNRDESRSPSREHERDRSSSSSSRKKDSKSFKEELLQELTKPTSKTDVQDDLFKVSAIGSISQPYTGDYPAEPNYHPDGGIYTVAHHDTEMTTGYAGHDPNYTGQYPLTYDHHQPYTAQWESQPADGSYSQVIPAQPGYPDMHGPYPPIPPDHVTASHQYSFPVQHPPHYPPQSTYSASQPQSDPYLAQPGVPQQQAPPTHLQPQLGPQPPHIPLDQHGQPVPGHFVPPQPQVPQPYNQVQAQTLFQPQTFPQEAQYSVPPAHGPRGPGLVRPVRSPLLKTPLIPRSASDTSSFASPRFAPPNATSSPTLGKQPESKPRRISRFQPIEETSAYGSPVSKFTASGSSSPSIDSPTTSGISYPKPSSETSSMAEPSFETSTFAESEFDAVKPGEKKTSKSSESRKKNGTVMSEEINEPTVSSSGVEDSTGDTGSDSGTDSSSQRPLKVKSRWRRNSEAEAVVDTSTPPQVSTPPPPLAKQLLNREPTASPTPESSPREMRRTRSRAAAEETGQSSETGPPPPPPRKRIKMGLEVDDEVEKDDSDSRQSEDTTDDKENEEQDLESLTRRPDFPKFEIIMENIHLTERKRSKSMKRMTCDCTISREDRSMGIPGCGSDCLNRMLMIECGSRCLCGEYCTNRRFQGKQYSKTLPFKAGDKGWGLKSEEDLPEKGTFIMEYVGEVLDYEEFVRRTHQYSKTGLVHHYFMALNADEVVDATLKGNISRFINHSCDPNSETQKWTVNGELRVGFFTRKNIKKGEELTFDYQFEHYGEPQKCYCGAENCRGYIGLVKSPTRNNKREKKKKKEIFKDELLEEDIAELSLLDGMRNKNHVLELCRLMVRAEKVQHRMAILKILQDTTEPACLRLFLDYHGLPLFWSWMADIGTTDYSDETQDLKKLMLSVLKSLPVTNKTILKESKILEIVDRWAVAAVAGARKPPPPPPTSTTPTMPTATVALADNTTDATAAADADAEVEEATEASEALPEEDTVTAVTAPAEPDLTTSSSSSPPSSPSPLPLPLLSSVTPVSILASAKDSKDAKRKRRVTFAEVPIESAFSPDPGEEEEESGITSTQEADEAEGVEDAALPDETGDTSGQGAMLTSDLPGEATASGDKEGAGLLTFDLKPDELLSSHIADSTSQRDGTEGGDNLASGSDNEGSDTECFIKDPIASLAAECMSQWSSLKEVFKIPKKERVEERKRTERELDVLSKKEPETTDPFAKWKRGSKTRFISRKRSLDDDEKKSSQPKMSKEERRQLFEAQVKAEDELAAQAAAEELQRQQEAFILHHQLMEDPQYFYFHQQQQGDPNFAGLDPSMIPPEGLIDPITGQPIPTEVLIDPHTGQPILDPSAGQPVIDPNTGQPVIDPNTGQPLLHHPQQIDPNTGQPIVHSHHIDPQTGQPLPHIDPHTGQPIHQIDPHTGQPIMSQIDPTTGQPVQAQIDPHTGQPITAQIDPLTGQPVAGQIDPQTGQPMSSQIDPHTGQPMASQIDPLTGQPIVSHIDPHTGQPLGPVQIDPLAIQPVQGPVHVQQPGQAFPLQAPVQHQPVPTQSQALSDLDFEDEVPPPPSPPTAPVSKLPPNWKTAKDDEGRIYYYHAFSRRTQWEMPSWDENDDDSDDMDLDPNPPEETKSKKKTTTAAADTSSEVARKIKEQFRVKMSNFIVTYLNPYRKQDCKIGRIVSTEDFKYLARKLTHHVMSKELKHCRHVEDLEVNENVKAKAKDYVRKYMSKFGSVFKKSSSPQPDESTV